jgi:sulfite reductase (ferredoxin)
VIAQKQAGYVAIGIKVLLGDFIRIKQSFNELIKITEPMNCVFIKAKHCSEKYKRRKFTFLPRISQIRFCYLGYDTINDITACPGTDTCNLELQVALELPRN